MATGEALKTALTLSRLGSSLGFAGLGALARGFWLLGTGPAGGESEREFERMLNENREAKDKPDTAGGEKTGVEAAAPAKPVQQPPVPGATQAGETKGPSTIWEKSGGIEQARKDFEAAGPQDLAPLPGGGQMGTLPDGRTIVIRPTSSDGRPTVEIQTRSNSGRITYDKTRYSK